MLTKLKNLGLCLLCFTYLPFRGRAIKAPKNPKKIAVFRQKAHMGDMVTMTSLFRAIKNKYPNCKLTLIGSGRADQVIEYNPDIDEFIKYENNFWKIIQKLRLEKIDFACMGNIGSTPGFALCYLAGIKCISLFDTYNHLTDAPAYNILKYLTIRKPLRKGVYNPAQFMRLLEPIDATSADLSFHLYFSEESRKAVDEILIISGVTKNDFIVAIAPGGSTEDRWWPSERFAKIAEWLYTEYHAKIFFLGAGKDKKAIDDVISHIGKEVSHVNLLNQSFDEFKAFVSVCKLVIGNDSGPMVTADAFSIPNLVIVGPTDERENHLPPGPLNRISKMPSGNVLDITLQSVEKEIKIILNNLDTKNG